MGKTTKRDLRQQILETSRDFLVEQGLGRMSMRKIARKVGVTATSIYLHFQNKDELLHTLIEETIEELNAHLEAASKNNGTPREQLFNLGRAYVDFAMNNPGKYQIVYQVRADEMGRYPKEKFRKARRGYKLVSSIIRESNKRGETREMAPDLAAYVFWAQLHGLMSVVLSKRLDVRVSQKAFIDKGLEQIVNGLGYDENRQPGS